MARTDRNSVSRSSLAAAAVLAALSPLLIGASSVSAGLEDRILASHNLERAEIGVPPLRWNADLARSAQRWADTLAASGRFEHAPDGAGEPQGENLWAGTKGYFTPEAMVAAWVREKRNFRPGVFPHNSSTGRVEDVGHYTQLVWRDTHEIGCARASGAGEDILVCRYAQAGNFIGQRPF